MEINKNTQHNLIKNEKTSDINVLYCELCEYNTKRVTDWIRHINSALHNRSGKKKQTLCEICNINFASHIIYKHHNLTTHCSIEEKSKSKYYCQICDYVFVSEHYYTKHINGIRHKNQELVKKSIIDIKNRMNTLNTYY